MVSLNHRIFEKRKLSSKIIVDPRLDTYREVFGNINIAKLLDKKQHELSGRVDRWTHESSGQTVNAILHHQRINYFKKSSLQRKFIFSIM